MDTLRAGSFLSASGDGVPLAQFLDIFGFLAVVLRALTLALGTIAVGGVVFLYLVLPADVQTGKQCFGSGYRLIRAAALGLGITQACYLFANSAILTDTTGIKFADVLGASFFIWACVSIAAAFLLAALVKKSRLLSLLCSVAIIGATVATSHSASRLDHRGLLLLATTAHQGATAAWIGALPFLLLALAATDDAISAYLLSRRFSSLAVASVTILFSSGLVMAFFYTGSSEALYGTTYGTMVVSKIVLFGMIVFLARFNQKIVRQLKTGNRTLMLRLRSMTEVEIGLGITAILAAASLTSQPPGVDLVKDRVNWPTIEARMAPNWPRMTTPPLSTLSPSMREEWKRQHPVASDAARTYVPGQFYTPSTDGDIAWSEYNHHWAGAVVLLLGALAMLSRFESMRWARYWPVAFVGLATFLLLRADPENWPLGPSGFWESFSVPDVAQHRLFVVLILLFAAFEMGVQTGRLSSRKAALVFPLVCAISGALLLTHTHALANVKEELLAELSHVPLALLAVAAGWARWLELRFPKSWSMLPGRVWPVCFVLIGVVLLLYREA
jgi:putative copper resistance protein D